MCCKLGRKAAVEARNTRNPLLLWWRGCSSLWLVAYWSQSVLWTPTVVPCSSFLTPMSSFLLLPSEKNNRASERHQVEFYFSRQNLQTDGFLVSQMNAQMCVPVAVIAQFHKIQQLTSDTALIMESVKDSTVCAVTPDGIKPSIKQERNTIILREIPSETPQDKVRVLGFRLRAE